MTTTFGWPFFVVVAAFMAAAATWFFYRIKIQKIWLPTLRVLELEGTRLRKLRLKTPPWMSFILFVAAALVLVFFSLKPQERIPFDLTEKDQRIHVFLDMSASVSAYTTVSEYVDSLQGLWNTFSTKVTVTLSSSHSGQVLKVASFEEVRTYVEGLGFHRAGIHLATAISIQKTHFLDAQSLVIVSDGDQNSWQTFNWEYFKNGMQVYFFDLRSSSTISNENVYIKTVDLLSLAEPLIVWDVFIERSGSRSTQNGRLRVFVDGDLIADDSWEFLPGQSRRVTRISIARAHFKKLNVSEDSLLEFRIQAQPTETLTLDNTFYLPAAKPPRDVLLVERPQGEREIEDSFYQLTTALEVAGFLPKRWDGFDEGVAVDEYPFVVAAIDEAAPLWESQCPRFDTTKALVTRKHIWLTPRLLSRSYVNLCRCFLELSQNHRQLDLCDEAHTQKNLVSVFDRLGIRRIGGDVRFADQSIAWYYRSESLTLTSFMVPLAPDKNLGIDHATFPLLVNEFLVWEGLIPSDYLGKGSSGSWKRLVNLAKDSGWETGSLDVQALQSNVPIAESVLVSVEAKRLPMSWQRFITGGDGGQLTEEKMDPLPWIELCWLLLLICMLLEGVLNRRPRWLRVRRASALSILLFVSLSSHSEAAVKIAVYTSDPYKESIKHLSDIVSGRTSLDLDSSLKQSNLRSNLINEPWIWTRGLDFLDDSGRLEDEMLYWIQRGGFLIMQNTNIKSLSNLMVW